jgi:uncharacterized protein
MSRRYFILIFCVLLGVVSQAKTKAPFRTLILTGQNNHNWQASSPILKQILDQTGLFQSDIVVSPKEKEDMSSFLPDFTKYQLVILDYNGDSWPEATNAAFLKFVKNGGGVVVYHAADNAFAGWKEFNQIIGLGGWGDRTEKNGPYVYYKDGKRFVDNSPGKGGTHGKRTAYKVTDRVTDHPITKGLPPEWMHAEDELYGLLRGPAENMTILSTAWSDPSTGGTGREEPVLMTIQYGKGRIFHTVLGHCGNGDKEFPAMECAGFIVTYQRGAEWAASGKVTQAVPKGFPDAKTVVRWSGYKEK